MKLGYSENKKRIYMLIAFMAILLLFGLFSGSVLKAQGEMKPDFNFDEMNEEHSQIVVTGNGYSLSQEQEEKIDNNPIKDEPEIKPPEAEESIIEQEEPEEKQEEKLEEESEEKQEEKEDPKDDSRDDNEIDNSQQSLPQDPSDSNSSSSSDDIIGSGQSAPSSNEGGTDNPGETNTENENAEPEEINKNPVIECSLKNGEILSGADLVFTLRGKDYRGSVIDPFYYQVKLNGNLIYSTGVDGEGFVTYRNPEALPEGENEVSVLIEDNEGRSSSASYRVTVNEVVPVLKDEYASVVVDARVLGLGILLSVNEPIYEDESAAHFVDRILNDYGFAPNSVNNLYGYYLARLNRVGIVASPGSIVIPEQLSELIGELDYNLMDNNSLGERDFNGYSGWVYLYNYSYMGVGLSNITLSDGDEIIICYTLANGAEYDGTWYYYGDW